MWEHHVPTLESRRTPLEPEILHVLRPATATIHQLNRPMKNKNKKHEEKKIQAKQE